MTDRAVSVTLNYVLSLAITTLLISGLLFATGDVIGDQRESVIREELNIVGERVSTGLESADRLARTDAAEVSLEVSAPERIAGRGYTIEVNATEQAVILAVSEPSVSIDVPVKNETKLASSTVDGGNVIIRHSGGQLEVTSA